MKHQEFRINKATGEIVGVYEFVEPTPIKQAEKDYYKYSSIAPVAAKNKDQVLDFINECVDKRKLVTFNNTNELHNMSCGNGVRNGEKSVFTLPQYKVMNKLIKNLVLANVVIGSKAEIAKILGVEQKNINQTLKTVSHLVRVVTENMDKGQIKILVHPAYGFKHESGVINKTRNAAVKDWCKPQMSWQEQQDFLATPAERVIADIEFSAKTEAYFQALKASAEKKRSWQLEEMGIERKPTLSLQEQLFIQDYYAGTQDSEYSR